MPFAKSSSRPLGADAMITRSAGTAPRSKPTLQIVSTATRGLNKDEVPALRHSRQGSESSVSTVQSASLHTPVDEFLLQPAPVGRRPRREHDLTSAPHGDDSSTFAGSKRSGGFFCLLEGGERTYEHAKLESGDDVPSSSNDGKETQVRFFDVPIRQSLDKHTTPLPVTLAPGTRVVIKGPRAPAQHPEPIDRSAMRESVAVLDDVALEALHLHHKHGFLAAADPAAEQGLARFDPKMTGPAKSPK